MMKGVNFQFTATNKTGPAMQGVQNGLRAVQRQTAAASSTNASWMKGMNANRRGVQQFGMQISDFAIQVGGGQSAMLAFVQQAPQMLQFFGAGGAAAAALVAIFGTLALVMMRSGVAMSQLTPVLGEFEAKFINIAGWLKWFGNVMIEVINIVLNNFDTLLMAAILLGGYFGGIWVKSIVMASGAMLALRNVVFATVLSFQMAGAGAAAMTLASSVLTGALVALRTAFMLLGIPALIIGAAWLVTKFIALRNAVGSFGEAWHLVWNLVKAVFSGMGGYMLGFVHVVAAGTKSLVAKFISAFADIMTQWEGLMNGMIDGWNAFVGGAGLDGLTMDKYVSGFASGAKAAAEDWANSSIESSGKAAAAFKNANQGIAEAFGAIRDLLGSNDIDVRDWFGGAAGEGGGAAGELAKIAEKLTEVKTQYGEVVAQFKSLGPLGAAGVMELNAMWKQFVDTMRTTHDPVAVIDKFKTALGDMSKQATQIYDALRGPMEQMFMDMVDGTKSISDSFKAMATSVIKELFRIMVVQKLVNSILGFFGISQPNAAGATVGIGGGPSFAGGGYTGAGARSGGIDGKGGFLATLHPNETVVDHTAGQGAGGVNVTQNITFGSGVTRAEVQTMIPKIVEATKAAVLDARKRGGAFGGAFA